MLLCETAVRQTEAQPLDVEIDSTQVRVPVYCPPFYATSHLIYVLSVLAMTHLAILALFFRVVGFNQVMVAAVKS